MCKVWKYNLPQQKRFYPNLLKWVKEMTAIYSSPWENIILRKNLLFNSRFCIQISNQLSLTNLKMILKNQIIILTQIGAETINLQSISHHLIYQRHTKLFLQTKLTVTHYPYIDPNLHLKVNPLNHTSSRLISIHIQNLRM